MIPLRYARFAAATQHLDVATDISNKPFFTQFPPALGLLRLRYVLNEKEGKWNAERLALPESPRAYFAEDWEVLAPEQILDQVSDPHFKPVPKVLLESDPGFKPQDEGLFQSKVEVADLSTDQLEVKAQLSKPGILVVTDNYSKGWKVEPVPGEGTGTFPVVPVFGFQRGVALPAGDHHFFLVYQPSVFGWGWKISLLSWLLFLGFLVVPFLRTPRPSRQKKSL